MNPAPQSGFQGFFFFSPLGGNMGLFWFPTLKYSKPLWSLWDQASLKWFDCSAATGRGVAAAAAKSLQSCPTLCDPKDGSPPGSPVPGILQARTLEWVAISFSNAWKWKNKVKSLSHVLATPWTAALQGPPSMGFSRQEYRSGVPLSSPTGCAVTYNRTQFQRQVSEKVVTSVWVIYIGASYLKEKERWFCSQYEGGFVLGGGEMV